MTNTLKSVRQEIGFQLSAAGVTTYEWIPPRVVTPAAIVEAGSPYMEQGETFTDFLVRMNIVLLAANATNEVATAELDELICVAIDALDTFDIEQVNQPEAFEINGAQYLGARLNLVTQKDLQT
jgi:hypothetical protein